MVAAVTNKTSKDVDQTPRTSCEIIPSYAVYTPRAPSSPTSSPENYTKSTAPSIIGISQSPTLVDIADRAPDGGLRAWLVVLGSFLIHSFCFAPTEYIFGVFEHNYLEIFPSSTHGSIALIGTLGSSSTYFAGFISGASADRFGYRTTALLGTGIMALALLLASFANHVWQLYLTQGVLFGIGASLVYYPAIGAPSHWFDAKRGLALGLAVSGTGLGGLALAPATQALVDTVGVKWALRVLAIVSIAICGTASFLIVERESGKKVPEPSREITDLELNQMSEKLSQKAKPTGIVGFFAELKVFKNPQFLSLTFAELAASIGFLIPMYYFQTYSLFIGLTAQDGALIAGLSSGASCLGRITLGFAADRLPKTAVVSFCAWMTAGSILIIWTLSKSFGVYLAFALVYGFFAGGYVSLVPLVISETFGAHQLSTVIGFMYAASGVGMLAGAPVAGMILGATEPNLSYLPVIMTAGGTLLLGACCISAWVYFRRLDKQTKRDEMAAASTAASAASNVAKH
ncbi:MAG: major facilitator superfamily domain-containing protein [Linnemannia elongata]|nr:MAG: major facilitator superfamily domain-containing protein [Linnemannia elongata]